MPLNHEFHILRATVANIELAEQAIHQVHRRPMSEPATLKEFLADASRYLILAIENDVVIGSLSGYALRPPHRREPQFLLYEIDVRPESQRRGIGTALVERFIDEARAAGAFEVWVLTGNPTRRQ